MTEPTRIEERRTWVEPTIRSLDVEETAASPFQRGDAGGGQPDCRRS